MDVKVLKTVRFTQLVETSGHPVPVTLWTAPEKDPEFSKAVRENRVVTLVQRHAGSKTDYGLVGFFQQPLASYLVFPKKLAVEHETKVIGIKYEQLAEPKRTGGLYKPLPPSDRKPKPAVAEASKEPVRSPGPAAQGAREEQKRHEAKPARKTPRVVPVAAAPPPPPPKLHFRGEVEIVARQTVSLEFEASSAKEARQVLADRAKELVPSLEQATIKRIVKRPKLLSSGK